MKQLSRISISIFFILFCSLCVMNLSSEAKYREHDNKAMGLWYEGSIYKSKKEYSRARESYSQSLALVHSPKLRREIEEALYSIDKHLQLFQEE